MSVSCFLFVPPPAPARLRVRLFRKRDRTTKTEKFSFLLKEKKRARQKSKMKRKFFRFWNVNCRGRQFAAESRGGDEKSVQISEKSSSLIVKAAPDGKLRF
jgi:hypothetical protein